MFCTHLAVTVEDSKQNLTKSSAVRNMLYDKEKRPRKYLSKWEKDFPWLRYDTVTGMMYCEPCKTYKYRDKSWAFVKGTDAFHVQLIRARYCQVRHFAFGTAPTSRFSNRRRYILATVFFCLTLFFLFSSFIVFKILNLYSDIFLVTDFCSASAHVS